MAHSTKALAAMQYGIDTRTEFFCHNLRGCDALGRMTTGQMQDPYKTQFVTDLADRKIDYVIYSYQTPIAWHYADIHLGTVHQDGRWEIPEARYSVTTTAHQRAVRTAIDNSGYYVGLHEHVAATRVA